MKPLYNHTTHCCHKIKYDLPYNNPNNSGFIWPLEKYILKARVYCAKLKITRRIMNEKKLFVIYKGWIEIPIEILSSSCTQNLLPWIKFHLYPYVYIEWKLNDIPIGILSPSWTQNLWPWIKFYVCPYVFIVGWMCFSF